MNGLMISANKVTMNHVKLCELINKLRKEEGNRKVVDKTNLLKKIDKEVNTMKTLGLSTEVNFYVSEYKDASGKTNRTYKMNRDGILQIASSESVYVRAKIIEYVNTLESKLSEQNRKSNLLLAIYNGGRDGILANKELTKIEVEEATAPLIPKANAFDRFLSSDGVYTSTQLAKVFKLKSAQSINNLLHNNHIIYKQGKVWIPYANIDNAWYKLIPNEFGKTQLKWTSKGILELANVLELDLDDGGTLIPNN